MFCGDVHLGRRPAGLPDAPDRRGLELRELGPRAALERAVEEAKRLSVDAFVFAGDVVDEQNRRFEAYGALRAAADALVSAGIATFAVAGNHDVDTLPRLVRDLPGFRLLGGGGAWEDALLKGRNGPAIALRGWSFPSRVVERSPFRDPRPPRPADLRALLGVVHGDLGVAASRYAPMRRRELEEERDVDAWFLGHVHKPSLSAGSGAERAIGYLGSLTALDRTETGDHGPWLVDVDDSGALHIEQRVLAPLRFATTELDVSSTPSGEALEGELIAALERAVAEASSSAVFARALGLSVRCVGVAPRELDVQACLRGLRLDGWPYRDFGGTHAFVVEVEDHTRPRVDLAQRARSDDPAGRLARFMLQLAQRGTPESQRWIEQARERFQRELSARAALTSLQPEVDLGDDRIVERLTQQARRALEALDASREVTPR